MAHLMKPTWESVDAHSLGDYINRIGAKHEFRLGRIGSSGGKIHVLGCYIYTDEHFHGEEIFIDCDSLCGYSNRGGKPIIPIEGIAGKKIENATCKFCIERFNACK